MSRVAHNIILALFAFSTIIACAYGNREVQQVKRDYNYPSPSHAGCETNYHCGHIGGQCVEKGACDGQAHYGICSSTSCVCCISDSNSTCQRELVPVHCRDFKRSHPDFQRAIDGVVTGAIKPHLSLPERKPVWNGPTSASFTNQSNFDQWYRDVPGTNIFFPSLFDLDPRADHFEFPLDNLGFGNGAYAHNYYFTCEIHTEFVYSGPGDYFIEIGSDDDAWAFVNNELVIDNGGVHPFRKKQASEPAGLVIGQTYALDIFFAERHVVRSRFEIESSLCTVCTAGFYDACGLCGGDNSTCMDTTPGPTPTPVGCTLTHHCDYLGGNCVSDKGQCDGWIKPHACGDSCHCCVELDEEEPEEPCSEDDHCWSIGGECLSHSETCDGYIKEGICGDCGKCCMPELSETPCDGESECHQDGGEWLGIDEACDGWIDGEATAASCGKCCKPELARPLPCDDAEILCHADGGSLVGLNENCDGWLVDSTEYGVCGSCCMPDLLEQTPCDQDIVCHFAGGELIGRDEHCDGWLADGYSDACGSCCMPHLAEAASCASDDLCHANGGLLVGLNEECDGFFDESSEYGPCGRCCMPELSENVPCQEEDRCYRHGGTLIGLSETCDGYISEEEYGVCGRCCLPDLAEETPCEDDADRCYYDGGTLVGLNEPCNGWVSDTEAYGSCGRCCMPDFTEPSPCDLSDQLCYYNGGEWIGLSENCNGVIDDEGEYASCGRCCLPHEAIPSVCDNSEDRCCSNGGEWLGLHEHCDGSVDNSEHYGPCGICCMEDDMEEEEPCYETECMDEGGFCVDECDECDGDLVFGLCPSYEGCCIPTSPPTPTPTPTPTPIPSPTPEPSPSPTPEPTPSPTPSPSPSPTPSPTPVPSPTPTPTPTPPPPGCHDTTRCSKKGGACIGKHDYCNGWVKDLCGYDCKCCVPEPTPSPTPPPPPPPPPSPTPTPSPMPTPTPKPTPTPPPPAECPRTHSCSSKGGNCVQKGSCYGDVHAGLCYSATCECCVDNPPSPPPPPPPPTPTPVPEECSDSHACLYRGGECVEKGTCQKQVHANLCHGNNCECCAPDPHYPQPPPTPPTAPPSKETCGTSYECHAEGGNCIERGYHCDGTKDWTLCSGDHCFCCKPGEVPPPAPPSCVVMTDCGIKHGSCIVHGDRCYGYQDHGKRLDLAYESCQCCLHEEPDCDSEPIPSPTPDARCPDENSCLDYYGSCMEHGEWCDGNSFPELCGGPSCFCCVKEGMLPIPPESPKPYPNPPPYSPPKPTPEEPITPITNTPPPSKVDEEPSTNPAPDTVGVLPGEESITSQSHHCATVTCQGFCTDFTRISNGILGLAIAGIALLGILLALCHRVSSPSF